MVMDPNCLEHWVTIHRRLVRADDGPPKVGFEMEQAIHLRGVTPRRSLGAGRVQRAVCAAVWEGRGPARSRAHTEYLPEHEDGGTRFDYKNEFRAPLGPVGALVSRALVGGIPQREATPHTRNALSAQIERQANED